MDVSENGWSMCWSPRVIFAHPRALPRGGDSRTCFDTLARTLASGAGTFDVKKLAASIVVALPLLAAAQEPAQPPAQPVPPQYAPPPQNAPPAQYPAAPVPYRRSERQRDSWYIGFGLGSGRGRAHFVDGDLGFSNMVRGGATTVAFNFRAGGTLTPKFLLGFDGGFVATDGDGAGLGASVQASY